MDRNLGYSISVPSGEVTGAEAELDSVKHEASIGDSFDPNLRSVLIKQPALLGENTESLGRTAFSIAAC